MTLNLQPSTLEQGRRRRCGGLGFPPTIDMTYMIYRVSSVFLVNPVLPFLLGLAGPTCLATQVSAVSASSAVNNPG